MPRYFFKTCEGTQLPVADGLEAKIDAAALSMAVIAAGEAISKVAEGFWEGSRVWRME